MKKIYIKTIILSYLAMSIYKNTNLSTKNGEELIFNQYYFSRTIFISKKLEVYENIETSQKSHKELMKA